MDVPSNLLIPALVGDKIKISNLITDGKNIICTNGQIGGYPKLRENGTMIEKECTLYYYKHAR